MGCLERYPHIEYEIGTIKSYINALDIIIQKKNTFGKYTNIYPNEPNPQGIGTDISDNGLSDSLLNIHVTDCSNMEARQPNNTEPISTMGDQLIAFKAQEECPDPPYS